MSTSKDFMLSVFSGHLLISEKEFMETASGLLSVNLEGNFYTVMETVGSHLKTLISRELSPAKTFPDVIFVTEGAVPMPYDQHHVPCGFTYLTTHNRSV